MTEISIAYLRECFWLGPFTNSLYWKARPEHHFGSAAACATFNARFAQRRVSQVLKANGYLEIKVTCAGEQYQLKVHRVIWALAHGRWPADVIDHKNRNRADNDLENIREATQAQNEHNTVAHRDGRTGVKGVHYCAGYFIARIQARGVRRFLGQFKTKDEAGAAYRVAALNLHGEFARFEK